MGIESYVVGEERVYHRPNNGLPKCRCPHSQILRLQDLPRQKGLCRFDEVKDLEIGMLFWVIQVGPI